MQGVGIAPLCHMLFSLCKATLVSWYRGSGMDITLDEVLTILDEHYNNVKVLDTLNQELFQLRMADKETVCFRLGCLSLKTSPGFSCFLPQLFSP